jgi:hypothetical protein
VEGKRIQNIQERKGRGIMKRRVLVSYMLLAGAFLLLAADLSQAENHGLKGEEESYVVVLAFDQGRPVIGTNRVRITVTDSSSQPVTGVRVKVDYFMPSLKGKPPMMGRSAKARASGGAYEATLKLAMKGEWRMIVSVAGPERTEEKAFAFEIE